jgi:hypothetical protein
MRLDESNCSFSAIGLLSHILFVRCYVTYYFNHEIFVIALLQLLPGWQIYHPLQTRYTPQKKKKKKNYINNNNV